MSEKDNNEQAQNTEQELSDVSDTMDEDDSCYLGDDCCDCCCCC